MSFDEELDKEVKDNRNMLIVLMWPFWVLGIYLFIKFWIWVAPIL